MPLLSDEIERKLGELYDEHVDGLYRYLLSFGLEETEARDALQDVFVRLVRKPETLDAARSRRALVSRIAPNRAIASLRRIKALMVW